MGVAEPLTAIKAHQTVRSTSRNPMVARTQESIDLDKERATAAPSKPVTRPFSAEQSRKMKLVYLAHRKDMATWEALRKPESYTQGGEVKRRWDPPMPRINWDTLHIARIGTSLLVKMAPSGCAGG